MHHAQFASETVQTINEEVLLILSPSSIVCLRYLSINSYSMLIENEICSLVKVKYTTNHQQFFYNG